MDFASEAAIVGEFHKFVTSGQLYRGSKPVMWSPVERTALADAEVEYHDHVSPDDLGEVPGGRGLRRRRAAPAVVIWTTTPWTIPANRAISYSPEIAYGLYEVEAMETGPGVRALGQAGRPADRGRQAGRGRAARPPRSPTWTARRRPSTRQGMVLRPPAGARSTPATASTCRCWPATTSPTTPAPASSTPRPATAPTTIEVWLAHGHREIPDTVDPDGAYYPHVPLFGGLKVLETEGKKAGKFGPANGAVMDKLIEAGNLLARGRLEHSYPHSWRSKAPVIFRNTPAVVHPHGRAARRRRRRPCARRRWTPSTPPPSTRRPARTASARWSRAGPTG